MNVIAGQVMIKKLLQKLRIKKKPDILHTGSFEALPYEQQKEIYDRMKKIFLRDLKTLLEAWNVDFYHTETIILNFNDFNFSTVLGQFEIGPLDTHLMGIV